MLSTDISKANKRRLSFSIKRLTWPIGIICFIIGVALFHSRYLRVKSISCDVSGEPCPLAIENLLLNTKAKSFLRLNLRDLKEEIEATGFVSEVKVIPLFPGLLTVSAKPPSVTYFLQSVFSPVLPSLSFVGSTDSGAIVPPSVELAPYVATVSGKSFALLSTGVLNQQDAQTNYYLISQTIPDKEYLIKVFSWLTSLGQSQIKPDALYLLPTMVVVRQADQPDWLMNFSASPKDALIALQRLGNAVTIKKPSVIDFRYSNPILK